MHACPPCLHRRIPPLTFPARGAPDQLDTVQPPGLGLKGVGRTDAASASTFAWLPRHAAAVAIIAGGCTTGGIQKAQLAQQHSKSCLASGLAPQWANSPHARGWAATSGGGRRPLPPMAHLRQLQAAAARLPAAPGCRARAPCRCARDRQAQSFWGQPLFGEGANACLLGRLESGSAQDDEDAMQRMERACGMLKGKRDREQCTGVPVSDRQLPLRARPQPISRQLAAVSCSQSRPQRAALGVSDCDGSEGGECVGSLLPCVAPSPSPC